MAAAVAAAAPAPGPTAEDLQLADAQQVAFAALDRHAWNGTLTADQYVPGHGWWSLFSCFCQGRFTVGAKGVSLSPRALLPAGGALPLPLHPHVTIMCYIAVGSRAVVPGSVVECTVLTGGWWEVVRLSTQQPRHCQHARVYPRGARPMAVALHEASIDVWCGLCAALCCPSWCMCAAVGLPP